MKWLILLTLPLFGGDPSVSPVAPATQATNPPENHRSLLRELLSEQNSGAATQLQAMSGALAAELRPENAALALFQRLPAESDALLELAADRALRVGEAVPGWSARQEVFDFIPIENEEVAQHEYLARAAEELPSEAVDLLRSGETHITLSVGTLASAQGATVAYCATITLLDRERGPVRYLTVLSAFSAEESEGLLIPAGLAAGDLRPGVSAFLPLRTSGTGGPALPFSWRRALAIGSCVLKTASCISGIVSTICSCLSLTPACLLAILQFVTSTIPKCCTACRCWEGLGTFSAGTCASFGC